MRFGYNTNGFAHHRLEDALCVLANLGYESVALTIDHHALNPYDVRQCDQIPMIRDLLAGLNLRSVVESGARFLLDSTRKHWPTLVCGEADHRAARLDFLCRCIDIAQALGAEAVSFWSGTADDGANPEEQMRRLIEGCRLLCAHAQPRGVRLAFEPEPGMFIDTMARFEELHHHVDHPSFGLTLDVGHLHCLGEEPIAQHIRRWRSHLWNVHIEDMRRGVHDHLMFGEGEIHFPPILFALEEIGYSGGVHVELSRHSHDAVEIARRALTFLRGARTI